MLLYLHIPFCDSKCSYCSFNSFTNMEDYYQEYMNALYTSLKEELKNIDTIETLFIGGGTPSTIPPKLYEPIFNEIFKYIIEDIEITIEANPNSATFEWLKDIKSLGVNRVSFGVQSFNDEKLKILNRAHSSNIAKQAIQNAYKVGFNNISLDIIYDLYSDTKDLIKNDLDIAFSLPINHISCYELTIEKATSFYKTPQIKGAKEELSYFVKDFIENKGFKQYEVSNYGLYKSKHNLGYWQYKNYLGVGAGAVGFIDNKRLYPHSNIDKFIKEPHYKKEEILSNSDILTEKILLGLRSIVGIDEKILNKDMISRANFLVKEGRLIYQNGCYYNKNFFLADEIAIFILG